MHLLPVYGSLLVATGMAIVAISVAAVARARADWALLVLPVSFVAAFSLDLVHVHYSDELVERGASVFELRGDAPWVALVACLVAFAGALPLAGTLVTAGPRDRRTTPPDSDPSGGRRARSAAG